MNNPCIECGKQRIDGKTWEGRVGASVVTYTLTICPDSACQKIIEKEIAKRRQKNDLLIKEKAKVKLAREKLLADSKLAAAS